VGRLLGRCGDVPDDPQGEILGGIGDLGTVPVEERGGATQKDRSGRWGEPTRWGERPRGGERPR